MKYSDVHMLTKSDITILMQPVPGCIRTVRDFHPGGKDSNGTGEG